MKQVFRIFLIIGAAICIQGYKRFGLDCEDIACESNERCIISRLPCNGPDQQDGVQCGTYPECKKDQLARDFSIDTTLTIANTPSSIIIPSTSTNRNRTDTDTNADFELLTDLGNSDNSDTHAGQTQANVLVIVQDGSQPQLQPNPWLNRRQNVPCTVNPLYPYACNYPGYVPNTGVGLPSYPQARSANGPQLVPPTPPCYYNCYPRVGASPYGQYRGYPLTRSANPSTTTLHRFRRSPQVLYQPVGMPAPLPPPGYPLPRPIPRQAVPQYPVIRPQPNPQYAIQAQPNPQLYFSVGMSYPSFMNYNGRSAGNPPTSFYSPFLPSYNSYYYNINLPFSGGSS